MQDPNLGNPPGIESVTLRRLEDGACGPGWYLGSVFLGNEPEVREHAPMEGDCSVKVLKRKRYAGPIGSRWDP